jgi:hypothetical protein
LVPLLDEIVPIGDDGQAREGEEEGEVFHDGRMASGKASRERGMVRTL